MKLLNVAGGFFVGIGLGLIALVGYWLWEAVTRKVEQ